MPKAICEDCGSLVDAELTHNGVCPVGHYVHCGWGHQLSPEDLISDDLIPAGVTDHIETQAAEIERLRAYLDRIEKASEFFTNPEHSELTLRYAHEGTQRLAREALTGAQKDGN